MTNNKQPEGLQEGIYFDLSIEDYHNDPAISCSGIKLLRKHPLKYWLSSSMNPNKKPLDTIALRYGKAIHCLLFEPENFDDEFIVLPPRVRSDSEKTIIREPDLKKIEDSLDEIRQDKTYDGWFKGGYPEVSIFWEDPETGLMLRCRFDYLNTSFFLDYKSTKDIEKVEKAIADYEYNIQSAFYLTGILNLKLKIAKNEEIYISGTDKQKEWINTLETNLDFRFLFQEKEAPYISEPVILGCDIVGESNKLWQDALKIYQENIKEHGIKAWKKEIKKIREIKYTDMPFYFQNQFLEATEDKELPI